MDRRRFLRVLWLATAAGAASPLGCAPETSPRVLQLLDDPRAMRKLGRLYVEEHPDGDRGDALTALLFPPSEATLSEGERIQVVGPRLAALIERDFASGNLLTVDGWRLSRTEVLLCALAYRGEI